MILTDIYACLLSQCTFFKVTAGMSGSFMGSGGRFPLELPEDFTGISSMPSLELLLRIVSLLQSDNLVPRIENIQGILQSLFSIYCVVCGNDFFIFDSIRLAKDKGELLFQDFSILKNILSEQKKDKRVLLESSCPSQSHECKHHAMIIESYYRR
jgi:hypothetical protein